jgi:hypothetical protein
MARSKTPKAASSTLTSTLDPALAEHAAEAFAFVKDEILAVPASELLPTNLDILRAAGRGSVAAERIAPLLPELEKLYGLDFKRIAWLGIYALALVHAHDLATEVGAEVLALPVLLEEATPLREDLLRSAELVAHFGVVPVERVAAIRSGHGHADTAGDLIALGRLFVEIWHRVHGKVFVTRAMVERATVLGGLLNKALAHRELEGSPLVQPTDGRHVQAQAFTVFARAYDEARRGVSYLRWREGDAHLLVPSLYPHRPRRTGVTVDDTTSDVEPEPVTDAVPEPTPITEPVTAFAIV